MPRRAGAADEMDRGSNTPQSIGLTVILALQVVPFEGPSLQ
jgi:hypothetical protein